MLDQRHKRNSIDYRGELLNIEKSIRHLVKRAQTKSNVIDHRILKRIANMDPKDPQVSDGDS